MSRRQSLLGSITFVVFAALVGRMWNLQVVSSDSYDELAAGNRTRVIQVEGPRGRLLDAKGRALADSRDALVVTLDHTLVGDLPPDERSRLFEELADELAHAGHDLGVDMLVGLHDASHGRLVEPEIVVADISTGLWIALEERSLPGVAVERRPMRTYPNGTTAAHLIGHLGSVADGAEAARLNRRSGAAGKPYRPGDTIGRDGLEQLYDLELRGTPEIRRVEVDARNRVVRTVEIVQAAAPGRDVHLTIDLDLQRRAEAEIEAQLRAARARSLADGGDCDSCEPLAAPAGSLVALRPADGSVVAIASYPTYDPAWFVGGLDGRQADTLFQDEDRPLLNRAIAGRYPAGSTFKPFTAYAALAAGARAADEIWVDEGRHVLGRCRSADGGGCVFRNAGGVAMGPVDLPAALARSSDTYFYSLGELFWTQRATFGDTPIQDTAERFGFGLATGIELPGERRGLVQTPSGRHADGDDWYTGDSVNLSIGQGDLLVTPVQLANAYATLAAGGVRHQPRLVSRVADPADRSAEERPPVPVAADDLDPELLAPIHSGLLLATRTGTAATSFAGFPLDQLPIGGKTGTAQVTGRADYSLFVAFGPWPTPDLAVAVVLEEAGFGGHGAAPAARAFLEAAFGMSSEVPEGVAGEGALTAGRLPW